MARNKYTYYASEAKKNGYEQIAALFLKTAENEKEHAKLWFRHLGGLGTVAENLQEQHVYVVQSAEGAGPLANHNSRKPIEGKRFFANFNFTVLDEAPVTIGDDCFIGPNVSIYTACHSTDPVERNSRREWAEPVSIGNNVWIGGSVTILPGVTIGDNVTIGAGSVVTKDIPSNSIAVGNPCKVMT